MLLPRRFFAHRALNKEKSMRTNRLFSLLLVLVSTALLHAQSLQDTWEVGKSFVGTDKEKFLMPDDPKYDGLRPTSVVTENTLALVNRQLVVTKNPIPENSNVDISFSWMWIEGRERDQYHDSLVVALRTTGTQREHWSHEIEDGLVIRFDPTEKQVSLQLHQKGGKFNPRRIASKDVEFKRYQEYDVSILDNGQNIRVILNDQNILDEKVPAETVGRKIAIY